MIRPVPDSPVPPVEMLWEDLDPMRTLDARFGFPDAVAAGRWIARTVYDGWGLSVESCDRIVMSDYNALAWVTTPSGRVLAKWSVAPSRFPRLAQVADLTQWLAARGLPVSAPLPACSGALQVTVDGAAVSLQHVIDAQHLDVDDPAQVLAGGRTLAQLHLAMNEYSCSTSIFESEDDRAALGDRVTSWLDTAGEHVPPVAVTVLRQMVDAAPTETLPTQLLHGDFRASNVLCDGGTVVAVLDLEEARVDHCIHEIARAAVLLGTRFRDWGPVSADVRATFLTGYEDVRPLSPTERDWWDVLTLWYSLLLIPAGDDPTGWRAAAYEQLSSVPRRLPPGSAG